MFYSYLFFVNRHIVVTPFYALENELKLVAFPITLHRIFFFFIVWMARNYVIVAQDQTPASNMTNHIDRGTSSCY